MHIDNFIGDTRPVLPHTRELELCGYHLDRNRVEAEGKLLHKNGSISWSPLYRDHQRELTTASLNRLLALLMKWQEEGWAKVTIEYWPSRGLVIEADIWQPRAF